MDTIQLPGNSGTYLDTAFHRYEGGADLSALALETLVDLPTEVFPLDDAQERGIPASVFFDRDVRGKAVLLHTGRDRLFELRNVPRARVRPSPRGLTSSIVEVLASSS
ncbi:hypothetical protein [Microbacterium sp. GXF0217]